MKIFNQALNRAAPGAATKVAIRTRDGVRMRAGVSLLISIVLISIVMVFALGVSNLVVSSLRQTANVNRSNQAFFAAEGALEQGLLLNLEMGAGFTTEATDVYMNCTSGINCPTATVQIQGVVPVATKIDNNFVIPVPGTGTAGNDCSPLAPVTTPFSYKEGETTYTASAFDHPCNWNKIRVGETVALPLYVSAQDYSCYILDTSVPQTGYYICNPDKLGLANLVIKVRTPCKDGSEMCKAYNRYELKDSVTDENAPFKGNDPIVDWQITGTNPEGTQTYALKPNYSSLLEYNPNLGWRTSSYAITDGLINSKRIDGDFAVIKEVFSPSTTSAKKASDLKNQSGSIINFLRNTQGYLEVTDWNTRQINKPILKLSVIHSLENKLDSTNIPYLEYQITTNANLKIAPTNTVQTIKAEGVFGTFMQVLEVKQPQESGLLEYVIQQ